MRKFLFVLLFAPLLLASSHLLAADAPSAAADPVLEKRVMTLTQELRCLVCQNQTIADSHADLAIDLKRQVREMMARGMSDQAIIDYMVQRYGDFVLYRPPVKSTTWLLWFGPFVLMLGGLGMLLWKLNSRAAEVDDADKLKDVSAADLQRAAALLDAVAAPAVPSSASSALSTPSVTKEST